MLTKSGSSGWQWHVRY